MFKKIGATVALAMTASGIGVAVAPTSSAAGCTVQYTHGGTWNTYHIDWSHTCNQKMRAWSYMLDQNHYGNIVLGGGRSTVPCEGDAKWGYQVLSGNTWKTIELGHTTFM